MNSTRPSWSPQTKMLVIILIIIIFGFVLYKFQVAIAPVVLAGILAYVLAPFVSKLNERWHIRRGLAILIMYLLLFIVIGGIVAAAFPLLLSQFQGVGKDIQLWVQQIVNIGGREYSILGYTIDGEEILGQITASLQALIEPLLGRSVNVVTGVLSSFVWIIFIIIISVYLIKDSKAIGKWLLSLVPPGYDEDALRLTTSINTIWSAFFRGQLLLALIMGAIITVEGLIVGLPFALAMGVLAGILEFLPSVGHGIWIVTAGSLALFVGSTWLPIPNWLFLIIMIILHAVVTQFDLNYLIPRVIGRSVHLPPLVVILGIVAGAAMAGVLGVVLAAPTIASLRVLGGYVYKRLIEVEPTPDEVPYHPLPAPDLRWWRKSRKPR